MKALHAPSKVSCPTASVYIARFRYGGVMSVYCVETIQPNALVRSEAAPLLSKTQVIVALLKAPMDLFQSVQLNYKTIYCN